MANTTITLESGRRLALFATGDPLADRLVIMCHSTPGVASFDPSPIVTERWGVHLVGLDRPGYGASDPAESRSVSTMRQQVEDIVEYVRRAERNADEGTNADMRTFGVIGWGTGALVAAAIAAAHPGRVDRLALVAAPSPHKGAKDARRALVASPDLAALHIDAADPDLQPLGLRNRLDRMLAEAYVQDKEGILADRLLMADDSWVPDLTEIRADTALFYGGRDTWVDRDDARWYQRHIAHAVLHEVPDSGHLVLASAWEGILGHVAPARGHIAQQNRDRAPAHLPNLRPSNER